jgi:hypothetical protein
MKRLVMLSLTGLFTSVAQAQTPSARALGTWVVDYDHAVIHMHGETTHRHEHGRMTLRSVGDSLFGELVIGDSTSANRSVLRGIARKDAWTVYSEEPAARGMGIFFSAVGSMMDWLRESVHGVQPVAVRFEISAKGDSLTGSRIVTGGMGNGLRTSTVTGKRTPR